MFKISFTKKEVEELKKKIYLSELQEKILEYRLKDISRVKMAELENVSIATIDRNIKELAKKIAKAIN